jgi:hypothetical protein
MVVLPCSSLAATVTDRGTYSITWVDVRATKSSTMSRA